MSLKCKFKAHHWDGCVCSVCGTIRNEHHELKEDCEKCSKCGKEIENNHDWSKDCEICLKCGRTREAEHIWFHDCEKCSKCGKSRVNIHKFEKDLCSVCGHGFFKDDDGKVYPVVKIGDQILMSQNYSKKPKTGNYWCYDNLKDNEVKYGFLYDWETAKTLIPTGWHIPTKGEWETLYNTLGGKGKEKEVYNHLKVGGDRGFEGLFGGCRFVRGVFNSIGVSAHFMSDTKEGDTHMWHFKLSAYKHIAEFEKGEKGLGLSVRLFKDK